MTQCRLQNRALPTPSRCDTWTVHLNTSRAVTHLSTSRVTLEVTDITDGTPSLTYEDVSGAAVYSLPRQDAEGRHKKAGVVSNPTQQLPHMVWALAHEPAVVL